MNTDQSAPVFAIVAGKPLTEVPAELFIPPDALEILLDSFSGPLDLLLYLIRRENLDILDIPIAHITQQYLQYIDLIETHRMELAAEYLVMAAVLAEIKSRLLLPHVPQLEDCEEDPRLELVRRLQTYEQIKQAALQIDNLPRSERDLFRFTRDCSTVNPIIIHPKVELVSLFAAMQNLIRKQNHHSHHQISREILSVRERMAFILERIQQEKTLTFSQLLKRVEGRMGLAVTFLAILELAKQTMLLITQANACAVIYVQAYQHE